MTTSALSNTDWRSSVARLLARMFVAFPAREGDETEMRLRGEVYLEVLAGLPLDKIEAVVARVISGDVPDDVSKVFAPSPAQLASMVRKLIPRYFGRQTKVDIDPPRSQKVIDGFEALKKELGGKVAPKWHDNPEAGLKRHANALGIDFETAMASIPDRE